MDLVNRLQNVPVNRQGRPLTPMVIVNSGSLAA